MTIHDRDRTRSTLEPDPETAPTVRRVYDERLSGSTDKDTARDLNRDQIPFIEDRLFTAQDVRRIRQNKINCGTYLYGKKNPREQIQVENAFPGIVTREEFDRAQ